MKRETAIFQIHEQRVKFCMRYNREPSTLYVGTEEYRAIGADPDWGGWIQYQPIEYFGGLELIRVLKTQYLEVA